MPLEVVGDRALKFFFCYFEKCAFFDKSSVPGSSFMLNIRYSWLAGSFVTRGLTLTTSARVPAQCLSASWALVSSAWSTRDMGNRFSREQAEANQRKWGEKYVWVLFHFPWIVVLHDTCILYSVTKCWYAYFVCLTSVEYSVRLLFWCWIRAFWSFAT